MFNKRTKIKQLLEGDKANFETTVMGWVRTFRNNQFIALNDGSTNNNLQVVANLGLLDDATLKRLTTGACIKATGEIIESQGKGQRVELKATAIEILGDSDAEKFPLQPKNTAWNFCGKLLICACAPIRLAPFLEYAIACLLQCINFTTTVVLFACTRQL